MEAIRQASRSEQIEFVELLLELPMITDGTRWVDSGKNSMDSLSSQIRRIITNSDDA